MSDQSRERRATLPSVVGILGSFLVIGALGLAINRYTKPAALGEDRAAVRSKALSEVRAAEAEALVNPALLDPVKGIVRLPIQEAMSLVLKEWKNPDAARSNLIARVEKATAEPPKAPVKPSEFE